MLDISDRTSLLAVQGPLAARVLQPLTEMDLGAMGYYTFRKGVFAGVENVLVSATGYTGSGGFEIYFEKGHSEAVWKSIFEAGARSEEHTSELQSLMRISYAVFCLKNKIIKHKHKDSTH